MTTRPFLILTLLLSHLTGWTQSDTLKDFRGLVLDVETDEPIGQATITIVGTDGSSAIVLTDSNGTFLTKLNKKHSYVVVAGKNSSTGNKGDFYLNRTAKVGPNTPSDSLFVFMLHGPYAEYLPTFSFPKNSAETNNPDNFKAWGMNNYQDTIHRIKVVGYSAPDELEDIALKRANKIIDGFVAAGANRQSFIAARGNPGYPYINYKWADLNNNGQIIKLNKKSKLTDDFIKTLSGDSRAAVFDFIRQVQLQWDRQE